MPDLFVSPCYLKHNHETSYVSVDLRIRMCSMVIVSVDIHCDVMYVYNQSQNRKGREILPSLSYHSNKNNRQRYHNFILNMEDDILERNIWRT